MGEPTVFGERLKDLRETRGLSQRKLAEQADVPPAIISHFETGERQYPSADNLVKIADALSVSVDYLLGRTSKKDPVGDELEEDIGMLFREMELGEASDETLETLKDFARVLIDKDKDERDDDGSG